MPVLPFELPPGLVASAARGADWVDWLDHLPRLVAEVVEDWQLTYDGPPAHGQCALVVPVRTVSGRPAALKIGWPHPESEHEHLALQRWHGNGAVELLRADPRRHVLLLERLHPADLNDLWDIEACQVVADLYRKIHVPALPQLRTLSSSVSRWTEDLRQMPKDAPVPRRLVEQAVALGEAFVDDPGTDRATIHTDLHFDNVLAGDREPWLAIDPKPLAGDPHYEVAPLLWNRWAEVLASGDVRRTVRERFFAVVDAAGLDEDRARDWVVVREMHLALWRIAESRDGLDDRGRDWVTRCITIAKAVQG